MGKCVAVLLTALLLAATLKGAEWTEPADGKLTEKQLQNYLEVTREALDNLKAAGKAAEGSGGYAALALAAKTSEKYKASLAAHNFSEAEFSWIGDKVFQAWAALLARDMERKAQEEMKQQTGQNQEQLVAARKELADAQAAQKAGKRILSAERRQQIVEQAKEQQKSLEDEIKNSQEAAKTAADEAAKSDAEAKAADALAKTPPADVAEADRAAYIEEKQTEAKSARDAAAEARKRQQESQTAQADAKAKLALAARQVENPDLPQGDDEKAELAKEQEETIKRLTDQVKGLEDAAALLKETSGTMSQTFAEMHKDVPSENVSLLEKYRQNFEAIWKISPK